jgi:hypothetical protein
MADSPDRLETRLDSFDNFLFNHQQLKSKLLLHAMSTNFRILINSMVQQLSVNPVNARLPIVITYIVRDSILIFLQKSGKKRENYRDSSP